MKINYKLSDLKKLKEYTDLYKRCFKKFNKNLEYFDWLYNKNPMGEYQGIDAFDGEKLIGQVGGIPMKFNYNNREIKTLVSINVCVDEAYRGNKLFFNLSRMLEKYLIESNFDLLIAVGNDQATPAWIKSINLKFLSQLKSFIGIYDFSKINIPINEYNLYMPWKKKLIDWRCSNPLNPTRIVNLNSKIIVCTKTEFPFVKAYAVLPFELNEQIKNINLDFGLKTYIGLCNEINDKFLFQRIPNFLKPSPLNFLYKFLQHEIELKKEEVFFSFLDFDAF